MNDGAKQAYLDKSAAQLQEWGAKVDVLKAKVAQGAAGVRADYHNQIERWQEHETTFKQKIEELRASSADGFDSMKAGAQGVWNDITNFFETTFESKTEEQKK